MSDYNKKVPLYIYNSDILTPDARYVYFYLHYHTDNKGQCYPSFATLARETGKCINTVRKCITEMEEKGVIKIEQRTTGSGKLTSNMYTLIDDPNLWPPRPKPNKDGKKTGKTKKEQISGTDQSSDSCTPFSLSTSPISDATYITSDINVKPYSADGQEHNTKIILNNPKDQVSEDYPMDYIKGQIGYDDLISGSDPVPCDLADLAADVIHDAVNNPEETYSIYKRDIPGSAVKSVFLKLDVDDIRTAIKQYNDYQKNNTINNQKSFMISTLYMERSQRDKGNQNKPKTIGFNNFESKPVFEGDEPPAYSDAWLRKHGLID